MENNTMLELQYLAMVDLISENSAHIPTREEIVERIQEIIKNGAHLSPIKREFEVDEG